MMKICVVQMTVSLGDRKRNREKVIAEISLAGEGAPDVIVLPELWDLGYFPENVSALGDPEGSEARSLLGELAATYGVNIVGGSIVRQLGNALLNTCFVFDRSGREVAVYDKTHLFSPSKEHQYFQAGASLSVFLLDNVLCGVLICYDLRFGELARTLALAGATVLFVPAAWPHSRLRHWQLLCQTRALENQCFLVGANACGTTGKLLFGGHSQVVDPWGEPLSEADETPGRLVATCDFSVLRDVRSRMSIFVDRRPELYRLGEKESNEKSVFPAGQGELPGPRRNR